MEFTIVCAWCKKVLGTVFADKKASDERTISHGMCEKCRDRVFPEFSSEK